MSRARKPLVQQKGNLTVLQQTKIQQEEEIIKVGSEHLREPPGWLVDKTAKDEFTRLIGELDKIDIVGNLDLNNIGAYCNAFSMYQKITKALKKLPILREEEVDGKKYYFENSTATAMINSQRKYADEMRRFAALCGLTIDSRLKAATVKVNKVDKDIEDRFGNI